MHYYTIRRFQPQELEQYKAMRLEALKIEPGLFSSSYERESNFPEETWLARLNGVTSDCFGLYCHDELIGITGVVIDWKDGTLAHMTQSYIREAHRRLGLSRMFYDTRLAWVKERPQVKTLRIGHRDGNHISKAANQRYGFQYAFREELNWPDGTTADAVFYELKVNSD